MSDTENPQLGLNDATYVEYNRAYIARSLESQHGLNALEAEQVLDHPSFSFADPSAALEAVRSLRVIYAPAYTKVDPALGHAGAVADLARENAEAMKDDAAPGDVPATAPTGAVIDAESHAPPEGASALPETEEVHTEGTV